MMKQLAIATGLTLFLAACATTPAPPATPEDIQGVAAVALDLADVTVFRDTNGDTISITLDDGPDAMERTIEGTMVDGRPVLITVYRGSDHEPSIQDLRDHLNGVETEQAELVFVPVLAQAATSTTISVALPTMASATQYFLNLDDGTTRTSATPVFALGGLRPDTAYVVSVTADQPGYQSALSIRTLP